MNQNDSTITYTTSVYALPPFYRVTHTHASDIDISIFQKLLLHSFGAFLYTSIHMLSSVLIYIATEQANYALWIGGIYLFYSMAKNLYRNNGVYVVDVETGVAPAHIETSNEPPCIPSLTDTESTTTDLLESSLKED
jgi:hypothetical protein